MAGSSQAGEDMEAGRTNESEERTRLVAINGDPDGYGADFVLDVASEANHLLREIPEGVDGIHATGTEAFATGGAIGTMPAGNGVVGRGANGLVGYVHTTPRDKVGEQQVHAGVFGVGDSNSYGVFGRGSNGIVGYSQDTSRDLAWESSDPTGVCGRSFSGVGVRGKGENGGVQGDGTDAAFGVAGKSNLGVGVDGDSSDGTGVQGRSKTGSGVFGVSTDGSGGVFESAQSAQLWLVPPMLSDRFPDTFAVTPQAISGDAVRSALPRNGRAGQLMALTDQDTDCTLWFCVRESGELPARGSQVLMGPSVIGGKA